MDVDDNLEKRVDSLEQRVESVVTELRKVARHLNDLETVRNQDMREIKAMLEKTTDARILAEVRRVTQILDGDESIGLKGMRTMVEKNAENVERLTNLRDKIVWIGIGVIAASGGAGALIGQLIKNAVAP